MSWILWVGLAWSSSSYPPVVDAILFDSASVPAECTVPCTLCHSSPSGGAGTVDSPFGIAMMDAGLTGGSADASLEDLLLDRFASNGDVDDDGIPDESDLRSGVLPGDADASFCDRPIYGCLNHAPGWTWAWVLLAPLMRRRRGDLRCGPTYFGRASQRP